MNEKIKKVICNYLVKDLYKVEIIYYRDSIWFIDRENRYWYFEYHKVDKHLWWRWSHFTQALKIFSMDAEKEQTIFGELVNMILTKKQKLESKYPNKIFKTVGSVMNFEDKDEDVSKNEIKTTDGYGWKPRAVVDEVLNNEVKTTKRAVMDYIDEVDEALNSEIKTTPTEFEITTNEVDNVLNNEVETTQSALAHYGAMVDDVLNYEVEKTDGVFYNDEIVTQEVLDFSIETTKSGELIEEDKIIGDVLEIQNIQPTERGSDDRMLDFVLDVEDYQAWDGKQKTKVNEVLTQSPKLIEKQYDVDVVLNNTIEIEKIGHLKTHRLRPVTGALDYNPETMDSVKGNLKYEVRKVLEETVEINSIEKLKGENPFQDIIVGHILDESDKVTDKLKIKEGDYVKTYSHDVYMCDHLVQNVLDVGVNSIHYDAEPHTPLIDGILKKT